MEILNVIFVDYGDFLDTYRKYVQKREDVISIETLSDRRIKLWYYG